MKAIWSDLAIAIPTFRRNTSLLEVLRSIEAQSVRPGMTIVIDNNADRGAEATVRQFAESSSSSVVEYLAMGHNTGPAGAFAAALDLLCTHDRHPRWMMCRGDDNPFDDRNTIGYIFDLSTRTSVLRPTGIGISGKRYRKQGQIAPTNGYVSVDYIPGGGVPTYCIPTLRSQGLNFRRDLFFGLEELEIGLQLKRRGLSLVAGQVLSDSYRYAPRRVSPWRTYFQHRNRLLLAKDYDGLPKVAKFAAMSLAGAGRRLVLHRDVKGALAAVSGMIDGLRKASPREAYIPR